MLAAIATAFTFWFLDEFWQIFVFIPIMGFCQLALFGGYAIYFPELFPTRLRSTGTSFCYNVGRLVAAAGPSVLGLLTSRVFAGYHEPMRYAGVAMCSRLLPRPARPPLRPRDPRPAAAGVIPRGTGFQSCHVTLDPEMTGLESLSHEQIKACYFPSLTLLISDSRSVFSSNFTPSVCFSSWIQNSTRFLMIRSW